MATFIISGSRGTDDPTMATLPFMAAKTAKDNAWFGKVFKSQQEFDAMWKGADRWRKVKIKDA